MNRATSEQALTSLIPTLNGPLPPELIELALSLLARSRSVAHSFKPDEEIARPYACAQLACERLKKRLNLPTIAARPPCPPRIYKKLYKYLESVLPAASSRAPETPRKSAIHTPSSTQTTPRRSLSARKTLQGTARNESTGQEPPEWAMSVIRDVVRSLSYPEAAPHVYTGVESIVPLLAGTAAKSAPETPSKRIRRVAGTSRASLHNEFADTRILALIAVISFYVLSRMSGQDITPQQFEEWRDKAVSTLLKGEKGSQTSQADLLADVEELMPMVGTKDWQRMDWYLNIVPVEAGNEMEGVEYAEGTNRDLQRHRVGLKESFGSELIGLGTMMQDATDYLGARQTQDYELWKTAIIARMKEMETS